MLTHVGHGVGLVLGQPCIELLLKLSHGVDAIDLEHVARLEKRRPHHRGRIGEDLHGRHRRADGALGQGTMRAKAQHQGSEG